MIGTRFALAQPVLIVLAALALGSAEPAGPRPKDDKDMNIRLTLSLNKDRYEVGEPILVTLRLTNTGRTPLEVPHSSDVTGRHDGYSFEVRNDRDETLKDAGTEAVALMHSVGSTTSIPPGDSSSRELLLNYRTLPLRPGKYTVRGKFQARGDGQAESPREAFLIVETPAARTDDRVARLVKELKEGADAQRIAPLLGFTGSAKAIDPLLDLLHAETDGVQVSAADALLYLDRDSVRKALRDSLKTRAPSSRLAHLLVVTLQAKPAEVVPLLLPWLEDRDGDSRCAAVQGLAWANRTKAPELFAPLKARLADALPRVRLKAAAAIGAYQDAEALRSLKAVVGDPDPGVSEQATIAVGWVAMAAKPESAVRKEAIDVLRAAARAGGRSGEQAVYWLEKVEGR
jgi:HEAT repeat protein